MKFKIKTPKLPKPTPSLRKQAKDFGRRAKPGRPYYVVDELVGGPDRGLRVVTEVRFTRRALVGLMSGSITPEGLWEQYGGQVYEDRGHPAIRHLKTTVEMKEDGDKWEAQLLGSAGHAQQVADAATGTRFRSIW
ncbi:hypothetical protein [Streptomyces sp. NBRC 109706]|uniref:hypothetical protein n=1 Tax=Streptomyces sp. NBRC 109706 TaxID=1550035 RepID=UPI0007861CFF|nr:hypothetical protein [Streptomyces sp. NBRC 109706]